MSDLNFKKLDFSYFVKYTYIINTLSDISVYV